MVWFVLLFFARYYCGLLFTASVVKIISNCNASNVVSSPRRSKREWSWFVYIPATAIHFAAKKKKRYHCCVRTKRYGENDHRSSLEWLCYCSNPLTLTRPLAYYSYCLSNSVLTREGLTWAKILSPGIFSAFSFLDFDDCIYASPSGLHMRENKKEIIHSPSLVSDIIHKVVLFR